MRDPDVNCFNDSDCNDFEGPYALVGSVKRCLCDIKKYDNHFLIHVNITSVNSNFERLHSLFFNCSNSFNIICVTETW